MAEPKALADDLCVSPFVPADELAATTGNFATVINNRPDGEEPGQPPSAELEATAHRLGLHYVHIPVVPGKVTDDDVRAFDRAVSACLKPILAFCRTGTRSATLWALSQRGKRSTDEILGTAKAAGYDLESLRPRLTGDGSL
jgi:uncharacterized protein (TIGR01244 family)